MFCSVNKTRLSSLANRCAGRLFVVLLVGSCCGWPSAAVAVQYDFLTVTSTGPLSSQFTSNNGNGFITVTHSFSPGGQGGSDNINTAIFPSTFTTLFPGTGQVQGHLAQTVYNNTSIVTFNFSNYNLSPSTVFGIWNMTDEVPVILPAPASYNLQVIDNTNATGAPAAFGIFNYIGNQDNQTQVQGRHQLVLNTSSGDFTPGATINGGVGVHTDAVFFDNLDAPLGTKEIVVRANLAPLNNIGDGVGYYFAEIVPEPSAFALAALGLVSLGIAGHRRIRNCLARRRPARPSPAA